MSSRGTISSRRSTARPSDEPRSGRSASRRPAGSRVGCSLAQVTDSSVPVLRAEGVRKRFGGVQALAGATLELRAGEVHGLCGENGSGKSTLLRVLSAQIQADDGRLLLDGEPVAFGDPSEALAAGIATVTQETTLVPDLSVAENIFLGPRKPRTWRGVDWRGTRSAAR